METWLTIHLRAVLVCLLEEVVDSLVSVWISAAHLGTFGTTFTSSGRSAVQHNAKRDISIKLLDVLVSTSREKMTKMPSNDYPLDNTYAKKSCVG